MSEPESLVEPCGWRYIGNAKGAKWTVQKNRPTHIETWPGYTVEPIYPASALSTLRSRCETLEARHKFADDAAGQCFEQLIEARAARDEAVRALEDAREALRVIATGSGYEWSETREQLHMIIDAAVECASNALTQPAGKEKG